MQHNDDWYLHRVSWSRQEHWDGIEGGIVAGAPAGIIIHGHSASRWGALDQALDYVGMLDFPKDEITPTAKLIPGTPEFAAEYGDHCGWTVTLEYRPVATDALPLP
jgi:hypothetical protein